MSADWMLVKLYTLYLTVYNVSTL